MRYYKLTVTPPAAAKPTPGPAQVPAPVTTTSPQLRRFEQAGPYTWTSAPGGIPDPSALLVEFDCITGPLRSPVLPGSRITVHGISLKYLDQAQNFAPVLTSQTGQQSQFWSLRLDAGFIAPGLPLEDTAHTGTIIEANVIESYGNWIGTDMSLTFVVGPFNPHGNFTMSWRKGTPLADALHTTLDPVFGAGNVKVTLASTYVSAWDKLPSHETLTGLARWLYADTKDQPGGPVTVNWSRGQVAVTDRASSTASPVVHQVQWTELMGQPTWVASNTLSVQLVMRGDLVVNDYIELPQSINGHAASGQPSLVTVSVDNTAAIKYQSTFGGRYQITQLRYLGNSRSTDSTGWSVVVQCIVTNPLASPLFSGVSSLNAGSLA